MQIPFTEFKKINKFYNQVSRLIDSAQLDIGYYYGAQYQPIYNYKLDNIAFKELEGMHEYTKLAKIPLLNLKCTNVPTPPTWYDRLTGFVRKGSDELTVVDIITQDTHKFKSLKLVPEATSKTHRPGIIQNDPIEATLGDYTYRFICGRVCDHGVYAYLVARNDEPIYDYLDKGYYYKPIEYTKPNGDNEYLHLVSDEYNVNTAKIFMMCVMQPSLAELLQDGCFINSYAAEMLCLKMSKKLDKDLKPSYEALSNHIDDDYRKNTTLLVVGKLISGDIDRTTINNVVLTKTSATYDHVVLEADDLLEVLYKSLDFNSEFDIYTIVDTYSKNIANKLEIDKPLPAANPEDEKVVKELPSFKINGISISASISSTYQRYINKCRINKEEICQVIYRASCHRTAEDYKLFVKSISKMSIKWHDVIANGIGVKIHSTITRQEYDDEKPGPAAPVLNFEIDKDEKCVKLVVSKDRKVKISLAKLVGKIETLNSKTNNCWIRRRTWQEWHAYRDYNWCQAQLIDILIEASTFTVKSVNEAGQPVENKTVLLNKEDILKVLNAANEARKAAVEKSKEFLKMAVDLTKAEEIVFMNEKAYKVTGALRTYAVIMKNAKVYDYETKQYRCIVNDRHYAGAGYDDVAARLLALKNDGVMQENIRTLRGAAQPGAENAHHYNPDRGEDAHVMAAVDRAFATA